jgi:cytochrome c oxidase assembly protein subunit 15
MDVPNWPGTFEYRGLSYLLFPLERWTGGVFWEHSHRMLGTVVGLMCIGMCLWLWVSQKSRPWMCYVGVILLSWVIAQGVMGGLRVTEHSYNLAILHGISGQAFFCLTLLIGLATSPWWRRYAYEPRKTQAQDDRNHSDITQDDPTRNDPAGPDRGGSAWLSPRVLAVALLGVLLIQLALGAATRHHYAGMAIRDFPLNYGQVVPPLTQAGIQNALAELPPGQQPREPYTPAQVGLHFAHRAWAGVVLLGAGLLMVQVLRRRWGVPGLAWPTTLLGALLVAQVSLGIAMIWVGPIFADHQALGRVDRAFMGEPHPQIATLHQAVGALILGAAFVLAVRLLALRPSRATSTEPAQPESQAPSQAPNQGPTAPPREPALPLASGSPPA